MTKESFAILTVNMRKMNLNSYIHDYCENRYENFALDLFYVYESTYADTYFYIDYKRNICVFNRVYKTNKEERQ